jgi:hypothetical protein
MQGLPRSTYACVGNPYVRTLTAITRRQHDYGLGNSPHQMQGLPRSTYACVGNPYVRTLTAITRHQYDYGLGNSPHQMQEWPCSTYACPSQHCVGDLRERRLRAMTRQSHVQQKELKPPTKSVHIKQLMGTAAAIVADQSAECMQCSLVLLQ